MRRAYTNDFADNDEAGRDSDSCLYPRVIRQLDSADFRQDAKRGVNCAFRSVFEGARKTEISQNAIAHELGDEAAVSPYRAGGGVLITPDQIAEEFGIDLA